MISVTTQIERWELVEPFTTARDSITHVPVLLATLIARDGARGWAEAAGVDYDGETPTTMAAQIGAVACNIASMPGGVTCAARPSPRKGVAVNAIPTNAV